MDNLQPQHQAHLVAYLRYARLKRAEYIRDVHQTFADVEQTRLTEATYGRDEVAQIIHDLDELVVGDAETELISQSHASVAIMVQYLRQAEQSRLSLAALDLQQIEDRNILEAVETFERQQLDALKSKASAAVATTKLVPLVDPSLLHQEIERLKMENRSTASQQTSDAAKTNKELEVLKVQVKALEEDLNGRLLESRAVQQMKKLLLRKNDELKQLRSRLSKHEKVDAGADDE